MKEFKGIILAGGTGTRLFPLTKAISKQLLPVYDKPLIYYPLSVLMEAGIKDILIITLPNEKNLFKKILGDGSFLGIKIKYKSQSKPEGLAQAFIIGKSFINKNNVALILGDNIFVGQNFSKLVKNAMRSFKGGHIFLTKVKDASRFGVVETGQNKLVKKIDEKPEKPTSRNIQTGLFLYDSSVIDYATKIKKSKRGEYEITDLNNLYIKKKQLTYTNIYKKVNWFDTGTHSGLFSASKFISKQNFNSMNTLGYLEFIALSKNWVNCKNIKRFINENNNSEYYLSLQEKINEYFKN